MVLSDKAHYSICHLPHKLNVPDLTMSYSKNLREFYAISAKKRNKGRAPDSIRSTTRKAMPTDADQSPARQWWVRINLPTDQAFEQLLRTLRNNIDTRNVIKLLVSGREIGDNAARGSFEKCHVHVYVYFESVANMTQAKTFCGIHSLMSWDKDYYIRKRVPSEKDDGLWGYITKERTKINNNERISFKYPESELCNEEWKEKYLPKVIKLEKAKSEPTPVKKEKKLTQDEIASQVMKMARAQQFEEIEEKFPMFYMRHKATIHSFQRQVEASGDECNHIWFYGDPGCGKSMFVSTFLPNVYNKDTTSTYWQGYNNLQHEYIQLPDIDVESMIGVKGSIGWNFLKCVVDPGGYNANVKYGGGMRIQGSVIITSNSSIGGLMTKTNPADHETLEIAIRRRYHEFKFEDLLKELNLELKDVNTLKQLRLERNLYIEQINRPLTIDEKHEFDLKLWIIHDQSKLDHFIRFIKAKELGPYLP